MVQRSAVPLPPLLFSSRILSFAVAFFLDTSNQTLARISHHYRLQPPYTTLA